MFLHSLVHNTHHSTFLPPSSSLTATYSKFTYKNFQPPFPKPSPHTLLHVMSHHITLTLLQPSRTRLSYHPIPLSVRMPIVLRKSHTPYPHTPFWTFLIVSKIEDDADGARICSSWCCSEWKLYIYKTARMLRLRFSGPGIKWAYL
jgi:hypothetical protein